MDGNKPTRWLDSAKREKNENIALFAKEIPSLLPLPPEILRDCTFARFTERNETSLESVDEKAKEKGTSRQKKADEMTGGRVGGGSEEMEATVREEKERERRRSGRKAGLSRVVSLTSALLIIIINSTSASHHRRVHRACTGKGVPTVEWRA